MTLRQWKTKNALDSKAHGSPLRTLKSNGQKILFIHINKTAGTSINRAIGIVPLGMGAGLVSHWSAYQFKLLLGEKEFNDCIKFSIVRNPYARIISLYVFRKKTKQPGFDDVLVPSFNSFFYEAIIGKFGKYRHDRYGEWMFMPQYDWLCDPLDREKMLVDRILKVETLQDDFDELSKELGQPPVQVSRMNPSGATGSENLIEQYFTDEQLIKDFNKFFKDDFEKFGYEMIKV